MSHISPSLGQTTEEQSQRFHWSWLLYLTVGLLVTAVFLFNILQPVTVLPRHDLAPGFALREESDQLFTSEDGRGRITLYNFTYSQCAGALCPQGADHLAETYRLLAQNPPAEIPVALVTITVDPERDTALVRQAYLAEHGGEQTAVSWHFLGGEPDRVRQIVGGGFGIFYKAKPEDDTQPGIYFEPRLVLVDGMGIIRAEYRTLEPDPAILLRDIHFVADEARRSTGAAKLAYEAAQLFMCYPR